MPRAFAAGARSVDTAYVAHLRMLAEAMPGGHRLLLYALDAHYDEIRR